jgi:hypothetical protein
MTKLKKIRICSIEDCEKQSYGTDRFCGNHRKKVTITRFLGTLYLAMSRRVKGRATKRPDLYKGKPILPKDVFLSWAKNHPDFLSLYKQWTMSDYDRKLTPTLNRIHSAKGYTLDNIEWMTNSQNCGLSGAVTRLKNKKMIYDLLGVNNVKTR